MKMTLFEYVAKHGGLKKSAPRIGIHWVTLSSHLNARHAPKSALVRGRMAQLGIDLKNYPGKRVETPRRKKTSAR